VVLEPSGPRRVGPDPVSPRRMPHATAPGRYGELVGALDSYRAIFGLDSHYGRTEPSPAPGCRCERPLPLGTKKQLRLLRHFLLTGVARSLIEPGQPWPQTVKP
jgi:hypothetical protein